MTKGEQARLTAWRMKVLQHAAAEQNVARNVARCGLRRNHVLRKSLTDGVAVGPEHR